MRFVLRVTAAAAAFVLIVVLPVRDLEAEVACWRAVVDGRQAPSTCL